MKSAILGAAVLTAALTIPLAFPAAAQRVPETPAAGTKTSSAATGFVAPDGMVNGSTSLANNDPTPLGYRYYDREAELLADPRYAPYEELRQPPGRVIID